MNDTEKVNAYMAKLDHPLKAKIEVFRRVILDSDERITERVKWNAPSFYFKDDFATFKLRPVDAVQIVFHRGAKVKDSLNVDIDDPGGLLTWVGKDRCVATFSDGSTNGVEKSALASVVKQWLEYM